MKHQAKFVGDLLAGQTEDFALVQEQATDWERVAREKLQRESDQADAREQQQGLFNGGVWYLEVAP